ncbi:uncharacterized protein LOC103384378 [Cynoglossus semilaevis]|uniref:Uncharacterized LOC103384378 n=1 Tax=Cynoglossus semilaevis TaxID=244447 RepID=A0A3P8WR41_CYNSE|nr:uncharacterized protein LOC103384378 [Cynoglossus semilaevis]
MATPSTMVLLLILGLGSQRFFASVTGYGSRSGLDSERGRLQLMRVHSLATHSGYGECWASALKHLDTGCQEMTSENQARIALRFTYCHLRSSGREFSLCPDSSEISRCTAAMDAVAFNTYTEFFTHTHSICHFLQSEAWQNNAEDTIYRLTETSAGVAEQLQSTRQMAEDLIDAQSVALQAQQEILSNGEELKVTLKDSTQGLRSVFSELSAASKEQQVALSELFNRVSFLHSFLLTESHSITSCCYNAAALFISYLLTATQRSSRARLFLLSLVCFNFYLEIKIYQFVTNSDHPEHQNMERLSEYIGILRRFMGFLAICVLVLVSIRYTDPVQQSLELLQQLKETQCSLQEALQRAEQLGDTPKTLQATEDTMGTPDVQQRSVKRSDRKEVFKNRRRKYKEEQETLMSLTTDTTDMSVLLQSTFQSPDSTLLSSTTLDASVSPERRSRRSCPPPLVYSVLVDDKEPRYSLRSRRSEKH